MVCHNIQDQENWNFGYEGNLEFISMGGCKKFYPAPEILHLQLTWPVFYNNQG